MEKSTLVVDLDYLNSYIAKSKKSITPLTTETAVNNFLNKLYKSICSIIGIKHLIYTAKNKVETEYVEIWKDFEVHRNTSDNDACSRCSKCKNSVEFKSITGEIAGKFTSLCPYLVSLLAELVTLKFDKEQANNSYLILLGSPKDYDCILRLARRRKGKIFLISEEENVNKGYDKIVDLSSIFELPESDEEIKEVNDKIQAPVLSLVNFIFRLHFIITIYSLHVMCFLVMIVWIE
jgi:hypothetical protein